MGENYSDTEQTVLELLNPFAADGWELADLQRSIIGYSPFYRLAAYTGARRGELLYLRWQAVDLNQDEVTFGGSTAVVRGQRIEGTTKGGRSRVVSVDRQTAPILQEHLNRQAHDQLTAGSAWTDSGDLVFVSRWGEPLYPDTVTALMNKIITECNKGAPAT